MGKRVPSGSYGNTVLRIMLLIAALILTLLGPGLGRVSAEELSVTAESQASDDESAGSAGADTDPTKPVIFSMRNEHFNLPGDMWQNVVTLRADKLVLREELRPWRTQGLILRADLPLVSFHSQSHTTTGLGDIYGQALAISRITPGFLVAMGTGLVMPTAGDEARPKVYYLTVTPTFLWRFGERWWTVVDAESNTDGERN
jgi:hypothetical protein